MSESCFTAEIWNDLKYDSPVLQMTCFRAKLPTSTSFPVFSDMKFGSCPTNLDPISCTVIFIGGSKGGARDAPPPRGSKFVHFHAVFGKKLKNNSTFGSWRPPPPPGKILDPPLILSFAFFKFFLLSVVFDPITRE